MWMLTAVNCVLNKCYTSAFLVTTVLVPCLLRIADPLGLMLRRSNASLTLHVHNTGSGHTGPISTVAGRDQHQRARGLKGQIMTVPHTFSTERYIGTPVRPRHSRAKPAQGEIKSLSLALQGGGAFGAFTWGVLDRLLEEDELELDAISGASAGASAGAINAVLLASGLAKGGADEARASLERFWSGIGASTTTNLFLHPDLVVATASQLAPYQFNPLELNPLRDLLAQEVDFEAVRTRSPVRLL